MYLFLFILLTKYAKLFYFIDATIEDKENLDNNLKHQKKYRFRLTI